MIAEIAELKGLRRGTLRIGLPTVGSTIVFAPLFAQFRRRHPNIDIELHEQGGDRLKEMLVRQEIDLGAFLLPVEETFEFQTVCNEPMMALLPHDHPLALEGRPSRRLAKLADSPMILFERGFALIEIIDEACRKRGFAPRAAARSSQPDFIVALVAAGLGVAMMPRLVVSRNVYPAVHLALIDEEDLRWRLALVWRKGATLPYSATAWLKLAEEFARKYTMTPQAKGRARRSAGRTAEPEGST